MIVSTDKPLKILIFFLLLTIAVRAQVDTTKNGWVAKDTVEGVYNKSTPEKKAVLHTNDSTTLNSFKPDPMKSLWMATIVPGYGQILNRKYWKLPIVYGGFLGCAYAISWNSTIHQSYLTAYRDKIDNDPTTTSYLQIIPKGLTVDAFGGDVAFTNFLKSKQDTYRRYRDLSIIYTIAFYALTIIDAYVDAQLYDFDISPDLSIRLQPTLLKSGSGSPNTLAMQCSISVR